MRAKEELCPTLENAYLPTFFERRGCMAVFRGWWTREILCFGVSKSYAESGICGGTIDGLKQDRVRQTLDKVKFKSQYSSKILRTHGDITMVEIGKKNYLYLSIYFEVLFVFSMLPHDSSLPHFIRKYLIFSTYIWKFLLLDTYKMKIQHYA